jgi:hypothetical protein
MINLQESIKNKFILSELEKKKYKKNEIGYKFLLFLQTINKEITKQINLK